MRTISRYTIMLAILLPACATESRPPAQLGKAEAAIGGAEQVGARGEPQAALYLKLAQEEMEQSKSLAAKGEGERADLMLMRSQADAELALALAQQSKERGEAKQALDQVRAARQRANSTDGQERRVP